MILPTAPLFTRVTRRPKALPRFVDQVQEHYARHKPAAGQHSLWNEQDHPRGQPDNAGEFAPKGQATQQAAEEHKPLEQISQAQYVPKQRGIKVSAEDQQLIKQYGDRYGSDFIPELIAKTHGAPENVVYHFSREGLGASGESVTPEDNKIGRHVLYAGRDPSVLAAMYGEFLDAEGGQMHALQTAPDFKWLDTRSLADKDRLEAAAAKEFPGSKTALTDYARAHGYDGIKYFDPWATGEELAILNYGKVKQLGIVPEDCYEAKPEPKAKKAKKPKAVKTAEKPTFDLEQHLNDSSDADIDWETYRDKPLDANKLRDGVPLKVHAWLRAYVYGDWVDDSAGAPSDDILRYVGRYVPSKPVTLYRGGKDADPERNQTLSWTHDKAYAADFTDEPKDWPRAKKGSLRTLQTATVRPEDILVDLTLLPKQMQRHLDNEVLVAYGPLRKRMQQLRKKKESYARHLASQLVERYAKMHEGTTKVVDGRHYVLQGSHWHRTRQDGEPAPSIQLRGDELGTGMDPKQLRKKASNLLRAEFAAQPGGTFTNADKGWPIGLSKTGRKEILSRTADDRKLHLLTKIGDIIRNAAYETDEAPKPGATYDWYYRFHSECLIGNTPLEFELIVGQKYAQEHRLYQITDLQEIRKPASNPGAQQAAPSRSTGGPSGPSVDSAAKEVKSDEKKENYARSLAGQVAERYQRQTLLNHLARQAVERYARSAAGQGKLFANPSAPSKAWREELHPRDHGKFTDKGPRRSQPDLGAAPKLPSTQGQRSLFGGETTPAAASMRPAETPQKPAVATSQPQGQETSQTANADWKTQAKARVAAMTIYRGYGSGKPNDHGVAGKGEYWSPRKQVAEMYGPQVKSGQVALANPLVATYAELTAIQKRLYGKMLTGFEPELSEQFDQWMRQQGYDGAILYEDANDPMPAEVVKLGERPAPTAAAGPAERPDQAPPYKDQEGNKNFEALALFYEAAEQGKNPSPKIAAAAADILRSYYADYLRWYRDDWNKRQHDAKTVRENNRVQKAYKERYDELNKAIGSGELPRLISAVDNGINQWHLDYPVIMHLRMEAGGESEKQEAILVRVAMILHKLGRVPKTSPYLDEAQPKAPSITAQFHTKEDYARDLTRQVVEKYSKAHDVSNEARADDGTWTSGGTGTTAQWIKARQGLHPSQFRRELEGLADEDLHEALEHVRSRGTAAQQHRLTAPLKAEIRSRGLKPQPAVTGGDVALQAIDEGRPLASVRQATGLKAGPEARKLARQAAAVYERLTRPEAHRARRTLHQIENLGEDQGQRPGQWTAAARQALGIQTHQDLLKAVHTAIAKGDDEFLRRFNQAMGGGGPTPTKEHYARLLHKQLVEQYARQASHPENLQPPAENSDSTP